MKKSVVLFLSVCLLSSCLSTEANASEMHDDTPQSTSSPNSNSVSMSLGPLDIYRAKNYWTHARLRKLISEPSAIPRYSGPDNGIPALKSPAPHADTTSRSSGLLTFRIDSNNAGSCTASFVNSSSRKLLVTAAHCLNKSNRQGWYSDFMFFPDYPESQQGLPISTVRVFDDWANGSKDTSISPAMLSNDVGFATIDTSVLPNNFAKPADTYGSDNFGHSGLTSFSARIVGYPNNPGNNTTREFFSAQTSSVPFVVDAIRADNGFSNPHGSSGGPWLQLYNSSSGTGWINGVTSCSSGDKLFSPRFTDRVYTMFNVANKDK